MSSNKQIEFKSAEQIEQLIVEIVSFFNTQEKAEHTTFSHRDFGLFQKWKLHLKNQNGVEIVLFSIMLRESNPGTFVLQDVNDETKFEDFSQLRKQLFEISKKRIDPQNKS